MNLGQIIHVNDAMFQVYRTIKDEPDLNIDKIKQFWNCSHAFKKENIIYFCREVESIPFEIIN